MTYQKTLDHNSPMLQHEASDYATLLEQYGLASTSEDLYYLVGTPESAPCWELFISVVLPQIPQMLHLVLPELKRDAVPFRLAGNHELAIQILSGRLGLENLGKIITIYTVSEEQAVELASRFAVLLQEFKGPAVLSATPLGAVVYAGYGGQSTIPFQLPQGVHWPFGSLSPLRQTEAKNTINGKYKVTGIIKEDAKGQVRKALFVKNLVQVKNCVIKEGRAYMMYDDSGRDMRERLLWQKELHLHLKGAVSLPKIYDYFQENNNSYLVLEYIDGQQLDLMITDIFQNATWQDVAAGQQLRLLDFALQILDNISAMHQNGVVHRDINTANFLVTANDKIFLIDLELAYSLKDQKPIPPFIMGTEGFMSPEQRSVQTPTVKEDIYALGATLLVVFTGIVPTKFETGLMEVLQNQLSFFIPESVAGLIVACMDPSADKRPGLAEIRPALEKIREVIHQGKQAGNKGQTAPAFSDDQLQQTITRSLAGLSHQSFLSPYGVWFSKMEQRGEMMYAQNSEVTVSGGFYSGASGIMGTIARAHWCGFDVKPCMPPFTKSVEFLQSAYLMVMERVHGGFYQGMAGIGLALAEAVRSGLLAKSPGAVQNLEACFSSQNLEGFSVARGVAGQGMAMLHCHDQLSAEFAKGRLTALANFLLEHQQGDGSWTTGEGNLAGGHRDFGLSTGIAGICSFLLGYSLTFKEPVAEEAALRGLEWLTSPAHRKGRGFSLEEVAATEPRTAAGVTGPALTLIRAYKITGHPGYRRLAEEMLGSFPDRVSGRDLSQASGLAGMGEIYLEAADSTRDEKWLERARWIAGLILHQFRQREDGAIYWQVDDTSIHTADLMAGTSGVIHFLMRMAVPGKLSHPILA